MYTDISFQTHTYIAHCLKTKYMKYNNITCKYSKRERKNKHINK